MANRSMLMQGNHLDLNYKDIDENNDILVACNYSVPFLWLCLFSSEDILIEDIEMNDGTLKKIPKLRTKKKFAIERVKKHRQMILKLIGKKFDEMYNNWINYLDSVEKEYIYLELVEIWVMSSDFDKFNQDLVDMVNFIDKEMLEVNLFNKLFSELVGIEIKKGMFANSIIQPTESNEIVHILCGYGWIRKVKWD